MKQLLAALLLLSSQSVFAAYVTGDQLNTWSDSYSRLIENQKGTNEDVNNGFQYVTYVKGVIDSFDVVMCVPASVTAGQASAITRRYLKDHP